MKILEKEDDWRISFDKCVPYITGYNVALDIGARGGEFAYYLNSFKTVSKSLLGKDFANAVPMEENINFMQLASVTTTDMNTPQIFV